MLAEPLLLEAFSVQLSNFSDLRKSLLAQMLSSSLALMRTETKSMLTTTAKQFALPAPFSLLFKRKTALLLLTQNKKWLMLKANGLI